MFKQNYASYPAVVLHELGHNFGLGHSGETVAYDDHSCLMGNPLFGFDQGKMCFNAAKSWQLGWYADAKVDYKPLLIGNESWTGKLVGVAQYSHADRDGRPVTLRIDSGKSYDYYINFNRKIGMNSQNKEGSDLVNVYGQAEREPQVPGEASRLLDSMHAGQSMEVPEFGNSGKMLSIKVDKIVLGDESTIGWAEVTICLGTCNFGAPVASSSPSSSPFTAPSPSSLSPSAPSPVASSSPTSSTVDPACIDSPYKAIMKMAGDGSKILLSCDAIDISLDAAKTFCEPDGRLATHCPSSCRQCDIGGYNVDSKAQFLYEAVKGPVKLRSCKWLNRINDVRREKHCTKNEKLRLTCRDTCNYSP